MAAFAFMRTLIQTRSRGHSAIGAAAYRFGLAATSSFVGQDGEPRTFDYSARRGLDTSGAALPAGATRAWRDPLEWARRVEAVDRRSNSRQCRDDVLGIPVELVAAGAAEEALAAYAKRVAARWKTPVHWVIHDQAGANPHAHVLYAGRQLAPGGDGFAATRDRDQDIKTDKLRGQLSLPDQHKGIWAEVLAEHGMEINFGPTGKVGQRHVGPRAWAIEKAAIRDEVAERIATKLDSANALDPGDLAQVADLAVENMTVTEALQLDRTPVTERFAECRRDPEPLPEAEPLPFPTAAAPVAPAPLPFLTAATPVAPEPLPFPTAREIPAPEPLPVPVATVKDRSEPLPFPRAAAFAEPPPLPRPEWWPARLSAATIHALETAGGQLQEYLDQLIDNCRAAWAKKKTEVERQSSLANQVASDDEEEAAALTFGAGM